MTQTVSVQDGKKDLPRALEVATSVHLVARIRQGSPSAESEFVHRYRQGLIFLVRHHTGDAELAKDIAQEALLVVLQRLRATGIEDPAKLSPFVHRTARNLMIGELRKAARRRTEPNSQQVENTAGETDDQALTAVREQEATIVQQLLCELRCTRDRQVLERFYLQDQDKAQVCYSLSINESHFNRVLYRARKRFAVLVKEFELRERAQLMKATE